MAVTTSSHECEQFFHFTKNLRKNTDNSKTVTESQHFNILHVN